METVVSCDMLARMYVPFKGRHNPEDCKGHQHHFENNQYYVSILLGMQTKRCQVLHHDSVTEKPTNFK